MLFSQKSAETIRKNVSKYQEFVAVKSRLNACHSEPVFFGMKNPYFCNSQEYYEHTSLVS